MDYQTFKTKTGFCHLSAKEIVLTREGVVGNLSKGVIGDKMPKILILYGMLTLGLIYFGIKDFQNGEIVSPIIYLLLCILFLYVIIDSLNNSAIPVIQRESIVNIKFRQGIPGLTRSRFDVFFKNENNKTKRRIIHLNSNKKEVEKALEIMKEEGLIKG